MRRSDDPLHGSWRAPRPGDVVGEKYEIERNIGSGGMGVVMAARHLGLGDRVALKFMVPRPGEEAVDEHTLARFFREAQLTARVKSEHVARVIDVGGHENGSPFMVMELLEGRDLQSLVRERGSLPFHEAAGYVLHACLGLAEAHAMGVVHRDLKPANLFLTRRPDGAPIVKLLDFGIGKLVSGVRGTFDRTLTTDTDMLGSPLYMSPEQIRNPRDVDARSDIWSLGAILYMLVAGRPPFTGDNAGAILAQILSEQPDSLRTAQPDVPPALEAAVASCLEKDPRRRMQRAEDLARALLPLAAPALGGRAWDATPRAIVRTNDEPALAPLQRRWTIALGAVLGIVAVAVPFTLLLERSVAPAAPSAASAPPPAASATTSSLVWPAVTAASAAVIEWTVPALTTTASGLPAPSAASATVTAQPRTKGPKPIDVLDERL